ncbi:hypothetical protein ABFT51_25290 [Paenibacillus peoriae]|uniref:hypothetical protein n=1 Tax=Paenibacillus peoriae TaxID=59893 RepID=UPI0032B01BF5
MLEIEKMYKAIVEHVAFPVQVAVQPHVLFHVVQIARIHAVGKRYGNIMIIINKDTGKRLSLDSLLLIEL